jgi:hypothetical protein
LHCDGPGELGPPGGEVREAGVPARPRIELFECRVDIPMLGFSEPNDFRIKMGEGLPAGAIAD